MVEISLEKISDDGHVSKVKEVELINHDGKMIRAVVQNIIDGKYLGFPEQAGIVINNEDILWDAVIQDGDEGTELSKKGTALVGKQRSKLYSGVSCI